MIKALVSLWKNIFNYSGTASRKDYWLGITANVILMYILIVPIALIFRFVPFITPDALAIVYIILIHLPVYSIYVRRARDAGWSKSALIWVTVCLPVFSGIVIGFLGTGSKLVTQKNPYSIFLKLICVGIGLFVYSSFASIFLFGTPEALSPITCAGLLLSTISIIVGYIVTNKK